MPKVDRNNPKRGSASESRYSLMEFEREFPDDATCLEWLKNYRWPDGIFCEKCQRMTKHHRVKSRPSYSCQFCGHHVHPTKGTIFENSATSLKLWFYAFYVMSSTRCGISAKQLEREIGVTYKTAWRMFKQIRSMLAQDGSSNDMFTGTVEVDEAFIGGRGKWRHASQKAAARKAGYAVSGKPGVNDPFHTTVLGMAERGTNGKSGRVHARVVRSTQFATLAGPVIEKVFPQSNVYTDEYHVYRHLDTRFHHRTVNHATGVYVSGDVHTNTIEGFWSLVQRGISGVYHGVSPEYLQSYLDEYVFRYNNRDATGRGMMDAFLNRIGKASE